MHSYKSIIKADYLQRTRSYGFLITVLVSICLAYTFIPPSGASYATVRIGDFIGENNAAWIGHVTAIMTSTFLWLFGFYLVNNGIKRDITTGLGQIVATTSISNYKYLLAKALSNFFVLLTIVIIVMIMALCLVIMRGGTNYSFDAMQFFSPYLFSTIPSIFFVSVLAVFAEVILGKYSNIQNILFFIFFIFIVNISNTGVGTAFRWFDVLGVKMLTDGMSNVVNSHYSNVPQQVSVGFILGGTIHLKYFLFTGTKWTAIYILSRLIWIGIALVLLLISAKLFHRFDVKESLLTRNKYKRPFWLKPQQQVAVNEINIPVREIHLSKLPVASPAYGILPFVKIELLMLLRKGPKWFWLVNLGGLIALVFMPRATALQIGLPALWFLQINRWSDIATKEKINRTYYFTYAAYKPVERLLTSQVIAGIILAVALASPLIIRYCIAGDFLTVISILFGAVFIVALSVCSGVISGGNRFFEVIFFLLTYANLSGATALDYFGGFNHGVNYIVIMFLIISSLLFMAFMFRKYEIRNQ